MKKISVIIPVFNESPYIESCLKSVVYQTAKIYEIIVIDDGSTDDSKFIVKKVKIKYKIDNLRHLSQKHQGPAIARNLGAKHAHGAILISLDADMVYDKKYIAQLIKPINNNKEIATTTSGELVGNLHNLWANFWDKVTFNNNGKRVVPKTSDRDHTFRAILLKDFRKVNGFDSFGVSDDVSVLHKLNKTSRCINNAFCYHYNPSTLSEVFYSARWLGRNFTKSGKYSQLIIFSPCWSLIKSIIQAIRFRDLRFILFRLIFDFGYWLGLFDVHLTRTHYK